MSDDNSPVVDEQKKKRGRQAKTEKSAVKEPKKRGRSATEKNNRGGKSDNEDDAPAVPAKRGRGRPKKSDKKKVIVFFFRLKAIFYWFKKDGGF